MANAVAKIPFSGSTQGQAVLVVATATAGTTIHTTGTSATVIDEVWLWLFNSTTADVVTTIEFGGATAPNQNIVLTVPFKSGLVLAVPGLPLLGSGSASLTVKAFAATASVVTVSGYVNRITP
jgi:energy-converting hydrogenase Eha subunit H